MNSDDFSCMLTINGIVYQVPLNSSRLAIWERYTPFTTRQGLYSISEKCFGLSAERYVDDGLLSSKLRMESLYSNLKRALSASYAATFNVAECGAGGSSRMMAMILAEEKRCISYSIFDTFSGLPESSNMDRINFPGAYKTTLETFSAMMSAYEFLRVVPGLVPISLSVVESTSFDFVHIDLDLYEGTLGALEFFLPRMRPGGIIQVDDYNVDPWIGATRAVDKALSDASPHDFFFFALPLGGAFLVRMH